MWDSVCNAHCICIQRLGGWKERHDHSQPSTGITQTRCQFKNKDIEHGDLPTKPVIYIEGVLKDRGSLKSRNEEALEMNDQGQMKRYQYVNRLI